MDEEQLHSDVRRGDLRIGRRQVPFLVTGVGDDHSTILIDGERMEVGTVSLARHSWLVDKDTRIK
jgi:hypothetical protein